jgi:hypothetical protein
VLTQNPAAPLHLMRPDGAFVPAHFHVTEVGRVQKDFIDCGGTVRSSTMCVLQVWVADDTDHRLDTTKLAGILRLAAPVLKSARQPPGRGRIRGRAGVAVPGVRRRGHAVRLLRRQGRVLHRTTRSGRGSERHRHVARLCLHLRGPNAEARMTPNTPSTEAIWAHLSADLQRFIRRRVADHHAADDLLQETFVRVQEADRLAAWVYRIARNVVHDHHRTATTAVVPLAG